MITDAHTWRALPDRGQHVLRCLYRKLTQARGSTATDELAIILAGQAGPLRGLLQASPPLAARFPAIINFPGYTPGQLAAIFTTLAAEAGSPSPPAATGKAAAVLARAEADHSSGNARLAVRLLTQATASQAHRITTTPEPRTRPRSAPSARTTSPGTCTPMIRPQTTSGPASTCNGLGQ